MWWVVLVDAVVVVAGLAGLGLLGWRLVVRPGLRLGRVFGELAEQTARATDELAAAAGRLGDAAAGPPVGLAPGPTRASRRTLPR